MDQADATRICACSWSLQALSTADADRAPGPARACILEARAAAHLKLEHFMEALEDANAALALDPQLAKAYLRKG
jgi:hypothetical protein